MVFSGKFEFAYFLETRCKVLNSKLHRLISFLENTTNAKEISMRQVNCAPASLLATGLLSVTVGRAAFSTGYGLEASCQASIGYGNEHANECDQ